EWIHLPKEILEKILKPTDTASLISARAISKDWNLVTDSRFLNKKKHIIIDILRISLTGDTVYLELVAESSKFAYLIPILNWFDSGKGRSIRVVQGSDENINPYLKRICLTCKHTDSEDNLRILSTLMSTHSIRVFCLQSIKMEQKVSIVRSAIIDFSLVNNN
ncbi:hypothetical protein PFISCL1PPCAC_10936, partial [Pristionchus fissidentatus]